MIVVVVTPVVGVVVIVIRVAAARTPVGSRQRGSALGPRVSPLMAFVCGSLVAVPGPIVTELITLLVPKGLQDKTIWPVITT